MADPHSEADGFAGIEWLPEIVATFPRPLAHTYSRLVEEAKLREPIAAVWALRDAWECAIRFVACLGLADLVQAEARGKEFDAALGALFKNNGLSLGDWAFILSVGCDGTIPTERPRLLHGLTRLYRSENGRLTELGAALSRSSDKGAVELDPGHVNVVAWRNKVFGHGVFRKQRSWYEQQAAPWIPPLHAFYRVLAPVLAGWTLRDGGPDGSELMGAGQSLPAGDHQHVAAGAAEAVVLQGPSGILGFGPLLSAQRCVVCSERHVFFYDKSQRNKAGAVALRTELLDYLQGHHSLRKGWPPALDWQERLPKDHVWERDAFDQREAEAQTQAVFHSFADEYLRPDWIMDPLWQNIIALERGYVHLEAPAGTGKSFIARAIKEREGPQRGLPVLVYHILPGARSDYRTFITLLADAAKEQLDFRTQEIQAKGQGVNGLRQQFIEFLTFLMRANRTSRLILVLDGIDQVPVSGDGGFAITDFLVPAADLPKGCVIVLTGRATLREGVADHLAALRIECAEAYRKIVLDPTDPENRSMLVRYALEMLPEELRRVSVAERIADRSRGVFLYAFHLVQALRSGAFASADELPAAELFYGAYLGRLRERVGDALYEGIYRKLLLFLTAAQAPITLDQLKSWGLRDDQLKAALIELADFIEEVRWRPWHERVDEGDQRPRYRIAHQDFVAYVESDADLSLLLKAAHGRIASVILNRHGKQWQDVDADSEEDVYDARFAGLHAARADMEAWASDALIRLGGRLWRAQRWMIAEEILVRCVRILRGFIKKEGHPKLDEVLAEALNNLGEVLHALNRFEEAEVYQHENLAICRRLVEKEGRGELAFALARALNNYGSVLHSLNRLDEAELCQRENVVICRQLSKSEGDGERLEGLARALNNHGSVLEAMNQFEEAEACQRENVAIHQRLIEKDGGEQLDHGLARALSNHGEALRRLKRLKEAEACQSQSVAIFRRLTETADHRDLASELATALNNHSLVLRALNLLDEAEICQHECVTIRLRLVNEGRRELSYDLAKALGNHGLLLHAQKRLSESEANWRASATIFRHLLAEDDRGKAVSDLAGALNNLGLVLKEMGRLDEAEICQRENVAICSHLAGPDKGRMLDTALCNHGLVLRALERLEEAEARMREHVIICRQRIATDDSGELVAGLAQALNNHGEVLDVLNRLDEAEVCMRENVVISRGLAAIEGTEYTVDLAGAVRNHGVVLQRLGRLREAEACLREGADLFERRVLVEDVPAIREEWAHTQIALGCLWFSTGQIEVAEIALSKGISALRILVEDNSNPEAMDQLRYALASQADLHLAAKNWTAALIDAEQLGSPAPRESEPSAWSFKLATIRGQAAAGSGESRLALECFDEALRQAEEAVDAGHVEFLTWRNGFVYRRASALLALDDTRAAGAIETAVALWREAHSISPESETNIGLLGNSLTLRAKSRLGTGASEAAAADAEEACALIALLVDRHWRYRGPLADGLLLLADAEERGGRNDRASSHRSEAARVMDTRQ